MGQLLYYTEGDYSDDARAKTGIEPGNIEHIGVNGGPDGKRGTVFGKSSQGFVVQYDAGHQEWHDANGYWIGFDKRHRPTPEVLQRKEIIGGKPLKLGDGNEWLIPQVRLINSETQLPSVFRKDAHSGELVSDVCPEYLEMYERASEVFNSMCEGLAETEGDSFTMNDYWSFCCDCLALNYQVNEQAVSALGLLTQQAIGAILRTAVDWDAFVQHLNDTAAEKKTEPTATPPG
jgi:hypothetical protein